MTELVDLPRDDPRWLRLVAGSDTRSPFHTPEWASVLVQSYGFDVRLLTLLEAGDVIAGIPTATVRGHRIALPFTDYCPPLGLDAVAIRRFEEAIAERVTSLRLRRVHAAVSGLPSARVGWRHVIDLDQDPLVVRSKFSKTRVEQPIRRAAREGVRVTVDHDPSSVLRTFYPLHVETRRRLGVPVQPRRFFSKIAQFLFPQHGFVATAYLERNPIASALFLADDNAIVYKYAASDPQYWKLGGNAAVLWRAIEYSCGDGRTVCDLGRTESESSGLRDFKLGWGTREEALNYFFADRGPSRGRAVAALRPLIRRTPPLFARLVGEAFYRRAA